MSGAADQAAGPIPYQGKTDTGPDQAKTDKCEKSPRGPATGELPGFSGWFFRGGVYLYVLHARWGASNFLWLVFPVGGCFVRLGQLAGGSQFFCGWFFASSPCLYVLFIGFGVGAWLENFWEKFLVGWGWGSLGALRVQYPS